MELSFQDWLVRHGRKPATIHNHLETLEVIQRQIKGWSKEELDKLVIDLIKSGRKPACVNHYIDTIRVFSTYKDFADELKNFKHIKHDVTSKGTFSLAEIEKFLSIRSSYKPEQDYIFWKTVIFSGARIGEIANLTINDIDWEQNIFIIRFTKTGLPRNVPIPPNLQDELRQYVEKLPSKRLFVTSRGNIFSYKWWQHSFSNKIKQMGIKRDNLTPYSFRHSYITNMLAESVSPIHIGRICGNSPEIIAKTYEHMVVKDLETAIRKHPLIRKGLGGKDILNFIEGVINELNLSNNHGLKFNYSRNENGIDLSVTVTEK